MSSLFPTCVDICPVLWRCRSPHEEAKGLPEGLKAPKQPSTGARKRGVLAPRYSSIFNNGKAEKAKKGQIQLFSQQFVDKQNEIFKFLNKKN